MSKYKEITIRIPVQDLKEISDLAVDYALDYFSYEEILGAGVDVKEVANEVYEKTNWSRQLEEGLVDHLQTLSIEFAKNMAYSRHPVLAKAAKKCEKYSDKMSTRV